MTERRRLEPALAAGVVTVALIAYLLGLRWPLLLALSGLNAAYLPMPRVLNSWLSRFVMGFLLLTAVLQVAAVIQFLAAPASDFRLLAGIAVALEAALVGVAAPRARARRAAVSFHEAWSLLPGLLLMVPFAISFHHYRDVLLGIGELAGVQVSDAILQFGMVAQEAVRQHFTYAVGAYYPNGFHIAAAFVENAVFGDPLRLGWAGNVVLYFAQYAVLAALLGGALYYLACTVLSLLGQAPGAWRGLLVACALAPTIAFLYLITFVFHGFVNYLYVVLAVAAGLCFLLELGRPRSASNVFGFLLFAFAAGVSWPLLVPPLVLAGAAALAALWPERDLEPVRHRWWRAAVALGLGAQAVPIYLQLRYAGASPDQSLNIPGNLQSLHPAVLAAGVAIVLALCLRIRVGWPARLVLLAATLSLAGFVAALALFQLVETGQVLYYPSKVSLAAQAVLVGVGVAATAAAAARLPVSLPGRAAGALLLALVPVAATGLLMAVDGDPLGDARQLFREYSGVGKPPQYDNDLRVYVGLGRSGLLDHANSTALHFDPVGRHLYDHEPIPLWANAMQYDPRTDVPAWVCAGNVYAFLAYGDVNSEHAQVLTYTWVVQCAELARSSGRTFYIVTDRASAAELRRRFGSVATIVS